MSAVDHNGHEPVCAGCRTPLRVEQVETTPLYLQGRQVVEGDPTTSVNCANCGWDMGSLDQLRYDLTHLVNPVELMEA